MKNWKLKFWSKIKTIAMYYIMNSKPKKPTQAEIDKEMKPSVSMNHIHFGLNGERIKPEPIKFIPNTDDTEEVGHIATMEIKPTDNLHNILKKAIHGFSNEPPKKKTKFQQTLKYEFFNIKPDIRKNIKNLWLEDDSYYKTAAVKWLKEFIENENELYLNLVLLMAMNDVQGSFEFKKGYRYIKTVENTVINTKAGQMDAVSINIEVVCNYKEVTKITFKQEKFYFREELLVDEMTEAILHTMKKAEHKYTLVEWGGLKKYIKKA